MPKTQNVFPNWPKSAPGRRHPGVLGSVFGSVCFVLLFFGGCSDVFLLFSSIPRTQSSPIRPRVDFHLALLFFATFFHSFLGGFRKRFGMILETQGGVHIENHEKLEFDDPLNENAMFLKPQGLQNEAKMAPKRAEKRKSREEGKREQRSAKRPLESVLGALWSDILRFRGSLGEGRWSSRLDLATYPTLRFGGVGP